MEGEEDNARLEGDGDYEEEENDNEHDQDVENNGEGGEEAVCSDNQRSPLDHHHDDHLNDEEEAALAPSSMNGFEDLLLAGEMLRGHTPTH